MKIHNKLAEILGFVDGAHISKVFMSRIGMKANTFLYQVELQEGDLE